MRIALITLALAALAFIVSIIYSMSGKEWVFVSNKTATVETDTSVAMETLKYQIKTDAKIDELTKKIEALSEGKSLPGNTGDSSSTTTPTTQQTTSQIIPISGKFLAKVMPTMEFSLTENNGIFDLHVFDEGATYSTYTDQKMGVTLIVSSMSYNVFLANSKALGKEVFNVNETKTFPFRSFYLNPPKSDTLVRIVIEIESQAIAIQIPKTKFKAFQSLLLAK
jgi:hypothetical protein